MAAFDIKRGIVSPGGIGFDVNCGVRLLRTELKKEQFLKKRDRVLDSLFRNVPSGTGKGSRFQVSKEELQEILDNGVKWALRKGYATKDDIEHTEDNGCIKGADCSKVSERAIARGKEQLGSIGSGNHFLEVQFVEKIYDSEVGDVFGLSEGQVVVLVHTGSRGLGHQVASDYLLKIEKEIGTKGLPDRQLACAPIESQIGRDYLSAMAAAANFAFVNRQLITHQVRKIFNEFFQGVEIRVVYDVAHNIAKIEEFEVDGENINLLVHRKGATRSFGPGRKELPNDYRKIGQPILIPGSMGTASYVLVGTNEARNISFASTAHGAGRMWSRTKAKNELNVTDVKKELERAGVVIKSGSIKGIVEEAPEAYKDVDEVVRVSDELGLGKKVARLKPIAVMKG